MKDQVERSLVSYQPTASGFRAEFVFPPELPVFLGHFPGNPIVPGVFLIEAVRSAAERVAGGPLALRRVIDARFSVLIRPGDRVAIEAAFDGTRCEALVNGETRIRLDLAPAADAPPGGC